MTSSRLASGGRIDRATPLDVSFDGTPLQAYAGDTLASALLASGIRTVARSVMLGRPRGITSAGVEESTALVQVDKPFPEPMLTATTVPAVDGLAASSIWGQGRLAEDPDPATYDAVHHHCEVAVIGAGPAGLAAAVAAASTGARVLLLDDRPLPGGSLLTEAGVAWAEGLAAALGALPNVTYLPSTTVTGYYDDNYLIAVQRFTEPLAPVRERVRRIRAAEVVLATGAHERPVVFAGNDAPGVMLAGAVREYLLRYGVLAGERVVLFTTHDDAYPVAGDLLAAGAQVVVVDPRTPPEQSTDVPLPPVPTGTVLAGSVVTGTVTDEAGELVAVRVRTHSGAAVELPADVLAVSGGWNPAVHLYSQAGGKLEFSDTAGAFVPAGGGRHRLTVAGAAAGLRTTAEIVDDGERAGASAAEAAIGTAGALRHEFVPAGVPDLAAPDDGLSEYPEPAARLYLVDEPDVPVAGMTTHFVDLQRDVTVADLARATGAGLLSVEHVKRYTTAGTAHDQGKTSGVLTTGVVAHLLGVQPGELGTTTFRPPFTPIAFATLAGRERGQLFDPVRTTGAHGWHVARGALFENVGQWKRPWYYPATLPGGGVEDIEAAVLRECAAARAGVAFMDGSTLGKIEVTGPDAGAFLDLLYTNLMSTLKVGMVRYGVMCGVDGMVIDDGTVFRLDEHRFLVTTTTGNAAKILDWMEEWHQTEWPAMQVWCTSVTEQWATMAVVGPLSRTLVGALAPGLDAAQESFPFMAWRDTEVAGLPARVARISFSGELAFEINVAWSDAAALWDAAWAAGEPIGLTPYGTETMHVLRAEKGFPIVGQDTDGTITPQDLGMSWVVSKKKADYIGKRSHARPDNSRADRKHLVGLLPEDPDLLLPEGSQIVGTAALGAPPVPMLGHVTSSYRSAALGRPFALALCKGGRDLIGETVWVVVGDVPRPVTVTSMVLVDPDGARRDGDPAVEVPAVRPVTPSAHLPVSPLAGWTDRFAGLCHGRADAGVRISEAPLGTQVNLRVRRGTPAAEAVHTALGTTLPAATGSVTYAGSDAVLALAPDEFLVLSGPGHGPELVDRLRAAVGASGSVTDVSASRTMIRVTGPRTRDLLAHGLAIDLDKLPESTCAQTVLAQCSVVVFADGPARTDDDLVKILVRSSFAAHLAEWLLLSAPEYV
ncbi:FAD-dependent oxidoreductase [Nakamurella sp. YIM 132087]|uniref:FAD-dependent oxidoreductase n=1 Tax=Nakamurella alba TaxID=2665158 RepID=A0A7K1FPP2_9ACTN|nr:2Fe-2S iron-sulfur cluster-binding protein [Nakamurella alba]MTD15329.1 FAD-dependent oxidoreductase [Nakamurella alba]